MPDTTPPDKPVTLSKDVLLDDQGQPYRHAMGNPRDPNCRYEELSPHGVVLDVLLHVRPHPPAEAHESVDALVADRARRTELAARVTAADGAEMLLSSADAIFIHRLVSLAFPGGGIAHRISTLLGTPPTPTP